jgi:hypothetical protein
VSTRDYLCSNCGFYRRVAIGFERRALHRRCVVGEPGKQQRLLRRHGTSSAYEGALPFSARRPSRSRPARKSTRRASRAGTGGRSTTTISTASREARAIACSNTS